MINPLEYQDWDDIVLASPSYSFFHSQAWLRVLQDTYQYKPFYLVHTGQSGFEFMLPLMEVNSLVRGRHGVSLPFTDFCPAILPSQNNGYPHLKTMLADLKQLQWKYLDFRNDNLFPAEIDPYFFYYRHYLGLDQSEDTLYKGLKDSVKRNIKKAEREQVVIHYRQDLETVRIFYELHGKTRKKHGMPIQPWAFFKNIQKHVLSNDLGFVAMATIGDKPIAANIYFTFGTKAVYKFGASDPACLGLRPNDLLMWQAIRYLSGKFFNTLCFGRTALDHQGLRRYKLGWGAQEETIKYYRYEFKSERFIRGSEEESEVPFSLKGMPVPILKGLGSVLYKQMG